MKKMFVATVQLVVVAEDEVTADDTVNNVLTECEKLYDWHYLKIGTHRLSPTRDYDLEAEEATQRVWETCVGRP